MSVLILRVKLRRHNVMILPLEFSQISPKGTPNGSRYMKSVGLRSSY